MDKLRVHYHWAGRTTTHVHQFKDDDEMKKWFEPMFAQPQIMQIDDLVQEGEENPKWVPRKK